MSAQQCGVCHDQESKYKCPHCLLRYCSVKCFKTHLPAHDDDPAPAAPPTSAPAPLPASEQEPAQPPSATSNPLASVLSDPRLQILYTSYPLLRAQLKQVFALSLPPADSGTGGANGDEDEDVAVPPPYPPAGSSGAASKQQHFQRKKTQMAIRGKWSQEKGDKAALRRLVEIAERDEGMREFVELCGVVAGGAEG